MLPPYIRSQSTAAAVQKETTKGLQASEAIVAYAEWRKKKEKESHRLNASTEIHGGRLTSPDE